MLKTKKLLLYFMFSVSYFMFSCTGQEGPKVFECTTLKDCKANQHCQYNTLDAQKGICANKIPCKSDNDCAEVLKCIKDKNNNKNFCGTRDVFSIEDATLPDASKGENYLFSKFLVKNNSFKDYYFLLREDSHLPDGLKLTLDGKLEGTPMADVGEYSFVVIAYNGPKDSVHYYNYRTAVKEFKIKVVASCNKGYIGKNCDQCANGYHKVDANCVEDEVCGTNSCTDAHKSVCSVLNGIIQCDCDNGYRGDNCELCDNEFHKVGANCIEDEVCDTNSCTEAHKSVCNIVNGIIGCSCDQNYSGDSCDSCVQGFHKVAEDCVIDETCQQDSCTDLHKTTCEIVQGIAQCYCDLGYTGANCNICDTGYHLSGQNCVIDEVCEASSCTETNKTTCNIVEGIVQCSCDIGHHPDPNNQNNCVIDEVCDTNSCTEANKGVCTIVGGMIQCSCDIGHHPDPNNVNNCVIDEICEASSCTEANKTTCTIVSGIIQCSCDTDYHPDPSNENNCVADEVCDENSCTEANKGVCTVVAGMTQCSCDQNYHEVNGSCVKNPMIDWCDTQWPKTITENNTDVYGRVYVSNVTSIAGASDDISAQLCYYKEGENIENSTCVNALYSKDVNTTNRDEYKAVLSFTESGIYHYYYQFKIGNTGYKKCDLNDNTVPINGTDYENGEVYGGYAGNATIVIANNGDVFISEYIEGKADDKFIELYAIDGSVDLTGYKLKIAVNGNTWTDNNAITIALDNVTVLEGTTFVIANSGAMGYQGNQESNKLTFNGNDVVALFDSDDLLIDILGTLGSDTNFAKDKRLIRKSNVFMGTAFYDPNEWIPTAITQQGAEQDNLGQHTIE